MSDQERRDLDHKYPFVSRVYSNQSASVETYRLFMKLPKHFDDPKKLSGEQFVAKPKRLKAPIQQALSKNVLAKIIDNNRAKGTRF